MYKAVIFDFFGVFCPDITLEWFKKEIPDYEDKLDEFQSICTKSDQGNLTKNEFLKDISKLTNINVKEITRGVEAQTIINFELVNYVRDYIHKDFKIACLSNGTHEWTLQAINDYDLGDLFDAIVLSGDLGIVKPAPEIYKYTLEKIGIKAEEAIFVDDRKVNIETPKSMGLCSLLFNDTQSFIKDFESLNAKTK